MSDEIKGMEFRQAVYDALKAGKEYSKKDAERVCTWLILTTDGLSFPMKPRTFGGQSCPGAQRRFSKPQGQWRPSTMTNQPIREALADAAGEAIERYYDETPPDFASDDIRNEMIADAALSILSTALAERDARIAELEEALKPFAEEGAKWVNCVPPHTVCPVIAHPDDVQVDEYGEVQNLDDASFTVADLIAAAKLKEPQQ